MDRISETAAFGMLRRVKLDNLQTSAETLQVWLHPSAAQLLSLKLRNIYLYPPDRVEIVSARPTLHTVQASHKSWLLFCSFLLADFTALEYLLIAPLRSSANPIRTVKCNCREEVLAGLQSILDNREAAWPSGQLSDSEWHSSTSDDGELE